MEKDKMFPIAYAGEMAKVLIDCMDWKEEYEKYKKGISDEIINLTERKLKARDEK